MEHGSLLASRHKSKYTSSGDGSMSCLPLSVYLHLSLKPSGPLALIHMMENSCYSEYNLPHQFIEACTVSGSYDALRVDSAIDCSPRETRPEATYFVAMR